MSSVIQQRYLSLNDTALYLGLSRKTLYEWVERGEIPAYKLGRVWRFDRDEVDRFVHRSTESKFNLCYNPKPSESAVDLGQKETNAL
jgi:excisionase family DNA binding protein